LLLHTNTLAKTYCLNVQVQTARMPVPNYLVSYGLLGLLGVFFTGLTWLISSLAFVFGTIAGSVKSAEVGTLVGGAIGLEVAAWLIRSSGWRFGVVSTIPAAILGSIVVIQVFSGAIETVADSAALLGAGLGVVSGAIAGIALNLAIAKMIANGNQKILAIVLSLLTGGFGVSLGLGFRIGLTKTSVLIPLIIISIALVVLLVQIQLQQVNAVLNHRKAEHLSIKP